MKTAWVVTGLTPAFHDLIPIAFDSLEGAWGKVQKITSAEADKERCAWSAVTIHRIDKDEDTGETTFSPEPLEPEAQYLVQSNGINGGMYLCTQNELHREQGRDRRIYRRNSQGGFDLLSDEEMKELLK